MAQIANIKAREVLDSRGNPTVEADVILTSGRDGNSLCTFRCFHRFA